MYIEWDNCPRCGAKTITETVLCDPPMYITKCSNKDCDWEYKTTGRRDV